MGRLSGAVCIFDLDGTLVDSAPDLTAALNRILSREGLKPMDPAQTRPLVGEGARALLRHGFEENGEVFPEGPDGEALVDAYVATYAARISETSFVFPGAEAALDRLSDEGAALAVCTNKRAALAEPLLEDLGLRRRFEVVIAADTLAERKPSPLPLRHIVEKTGAKRAIMIGDTTTDAKAASAAAMPVLIAAFGYGSNDPALSSAEVFESYTALPDQILSRIGSAR